ncbi:leucine-rich repeat receptor protein kinase HPCA1 isoform X1 [Elaeis guineensis]|uniref:leucine-rich repeat receptor protein kinase HPCA1 isoform X1 n=1 Tax=Elaeis guineensis var. tenera TaxID=51953 RepID=UPI003C6D94CD
MASKSWRITGGRKGMVTPSSPSCCMGTGLLLLLAFVSGLRVGYGITDPTDAAAVRSLIDTWQNTPPSWGQSDDPCGTPWVGVSCHGSRVTALTLSTMGLKGILSGDIGQLSELQSLDLSYNNELGGPLTANIGNLKKLATLILVGCSFSGQIPDELGNLGKLSYLALNSNKFTGSIPASLGTLSNLYWLDVSDNQLSGPIPISKNGAPGLDQLLHTKHFHFTKNKLSGPIPDQLFSSNMSLIHILFDGNELTGEIPASIGLVESLEVLRLDRNSLTGSVPSSINKLTTISELGLANNQLSGPMPDLTGMNALSFVDLSNNTFDPSEIPAWLSQTESLTVLVIQSGGLHGQVPEKLFSHPRLQQVILDDNKFNGTLVMGDSVSQQLQIVSFKNNDLESVIPSPSYTKTLILSGNPVCNNPRSEDIYCRVHQNQSLPYSTSLAKCGPNQCPPEQSLSPSECNCAYPYEGEMFFRGPGFRDVTNSTLFQELESTMWTALGLQPGSVFLDNPSFTDDSYLQLQVKLFPSDGMYFNRSEIQRIGFDLSNQTYKPPDVFGPYNFMASPYPFPDVAGRSPMRATRAGLIAGISVGGALLVLGLVGAGVYALRQKKRAQRALELSKPFASWTHSEDCAGAPQLKGARWFSFDELKKSTNSFSETNEIGSGGYGKVYRGMLSSGQLVAIKRAQEGSKQGAHEFRNEIELLSRVHHKNLVGLVGFCFEKGEQMLVYEFMHNGTLRQSLSGKSGIKLDWKRRLRIALGSARGLAYLHELADPPIIHRDVKSSNILLDENLNAKVADFGLSKLVSDCERGHVTTQVKGTMGYLDPEYYLTQQLSDKSDVYSFGVVMLELLTARQPIKKGNYIVREVKTAINMNDEEHYGLKEIMDPIIQNTTHLIAFRRFIELAMRCVEESAADRPTMSNVVKEIETMLHNTGMDTNSNSASSSATDFGNTKGDLHHPYSDSFPRKDVSSGAFEYSGGYSPLADPEPQ